MTRHVYGVSEDKTEKKEREAILRAGGLRIFSPENSRGGDCPDVDWPATLPFVRPAKPEPPRRKCRTPSCTPKLRIFQG